MESKTITCIGSHVIASGEDLGHLQHFPRSFMQRLRVWGSSYNYVYVNFTREINFKVVATPQAHTHLTCFCVRRWAERVS